MALHSQERNDEHTAIDALLADGGGIIRERDLDDFDVAPGIDAVLLEHHPQGQIDRRSKGVDADFLAFQIGQSLLIGESFSTMKLFARCQAGRPGNCPR